MRDNLARLKQELARLERGSGDRERPTFSLGAPDVDAMVEGLRRGAVHEAYAMTPADAASVSGFALGLALRAAGRRPIIWARPDYAGLEAGGLYAPGLAAMGLDPRQLTLVRARKPIDVLRAGEAAAGCAALGAVVLEIWGDSQALDLTASRRLSLAAGVSDVPLIMIRAEARPVASAAATRWQVRAAASVPLEANAPGQPAFEITLLRNRTGCAGGKWMVEWNRDRQSFREVTPVARGVAPVPGDGHAPAAHAGGWREAG